MEGRAPVIERILLAKKILKAHRDSLLRDPFIGPLLQELKVIVEAAERERIEAGIAMECARCGSLQRDCCGQGIELRYSRELLLINLLLRTELPEKQIDKNSCYFLTPKGCCLTVREVFCVNYLCRMITDTISPARLGYLRELEGEMLEITFRLEERIKASLSSNVLNPKSSDKQD